MPGGTTVFRALASADAMWAIRESSARRIGARGGASIVLFKKRADRVAMRVKNEKVGGEARRGRQSVSLRAKIAVRLLTCSVRDQQILSNQTDSSGCHWQFITFNFTARISLRVSKLQIHTSELQARHVRPRCFGSKDPDGV